MQLALLKNLYIHSCILVLQLQNYQGLGGLFHSGYLGDQEDFEYVVLDLLTKKIPLIKISEYH